MKILFNVLVHQNPERINFIVDNIIKFTENPIIVLHFNSIYTDGYDVINKRNEVFINPERFSNGQYESRLDAILSNHNYITNILKIDYDYECIFYQKFCFFKKGIEDYLINYDSLLWLGDKHLDEYVDDVRLYEDIVNGEYLSYLNYLKDPVEENLKHIFIIRDTNKKILLDNLKRLGEDSYDYKIAIDIINVVSEYDYEISKFLLHFAEMTFFKKEIALNIFNDINNMFIRKITKKVVVEECLVPSLVLKYSKRINMCPVIMNPTGDIDIDQLIGDIKINKTIKNRFGYTYTKNLFIVHCHDFNRIKNSSLFTHTR